MTRFKSLNPVLKRLVVEISSSGALAFIIVSLFYSAMSPAPLSLSYLVQMV